MFMLISDDSAMYSTDCSASEPLSFFQIFPAASYPKGNPPPSDTDGLVFRSGLWIKRFFFLSPRLGELEDALKDKLGIRKTLQALGCFAACCFHFPFVNFHSLFGNEYLKLSQVYTKMCGWAEVCWSYPTPCICFQCFCVDVATCHVTSMVLALNYSCCGITST